MPRSCARVMPPHPPPRDTSGGCAHCVALTITPLPAGREGVQVRGVWPGVHPAGEHEAAHADPHQRPALPVPHLLQDLCAEADPQDTHDCTLAREAIQMQGMRPQARGCALFTGGLVSAGLRQLWPTESWHSQCGQGGPWLGET